MESKKKTVIFDTSGINALAKEMTGATASVVGIGFLVKITGTNVAEVGATPEPSLRKRLLATLRLISSNGICLIPSRWVIHRHPEEFLKDPDRYDWQKVDVRARGIERTIAGDTLLDDKNSGVLSAENEELEKQFKDLHKSERTRFDAFIRKAARPSFPEYCSVVLQNGGPAWNLGVSMFKQVTNVELDERELRIFLQKCPPWRAVFVALLWSHHRMCIMDPRGKSIKRAGRHDLMSAVYLPYSDILVTCDEGQYRALTVIAPQAEVGTDIRTHEAFSSSLLCTLT